MPRIAATLGVFGLVVLALGLNMVQFPIECRGVAPPVVPCEPAGEAPPVEPPQFPVVALRSAPAEAERLPQGVQPIGEQQPQGSAEPPVPLPPTTEQANEQTGGPDASSPDEPKAPPVETPIESVAVEVPPSADPVDHVPKSADRCDGPAAGGVYNPLVPELAACPIPVAQAMPERPVDPTRPAEVQPGPPYATARPLNVTAGRDMVPINPEAAAEPTVSASVSGVTRLPPVDRVWPGVAADQPLDPDRIADQDTYPATQGSPE